MSNKLKNSSQVLSMNFGSLGSVDITQYEEIDTEVFAKNFESSGSYPTGPDYNDDCNLNPGLCGMGPLDPTLAPI